MKSKPIVINSPTPAPSPSDVRAASFDEDQTPPENSFLGKYYRPNRNVQTQGSAPASGGGKAPAAPEVTQVQAKQETGVDRAGNRGSNIYTSATLAPTESTRPQSNPNYTSQAPAAKAARTTVNPNQPTAAAYSRGTGAVVVTNQGRTPAATVPSRGTGAVVVTNQGRAPVSTPSRASGGVKVTNQGRAPTKDKPKSGRV